MTLQTKIAQAMKERFRKLELDISEEIFADYDRKVLSWMMRYKKNELTPKQIEKGQFPTFTNNFAINIGRLLEGDEVKSRLGNQFYKDAVEGIIKIGLTPEKVLQLYRTDCELYLPYHQKLTELSIILSREPTEKNRKRMLNAIKKTPDSTFNQTIFPLYFVLREKGYSDFDLCA